MKAEERQNILEIFEKLTDVKEVIENINCLLELVLISRQESGDGYAERREMKHLYNFNAGISNNIIEILGELENIGDFRMELGEVE